MKGRYQNEEKVRNFLNGLVTFFIWVIMSYTIYLNDLFKILALIVLYGVVFYLIKNVFFLPHYKRRAIKINYREIDLDYPYDDKEKLYFRKSAENAEHLKNEYGIVLFVLWTAIIFFIINYITKFYSTDYRFLNLLISLSIWIAPISAIFWLDRKYEKWFPVYRDYENMQKDSEGIYKYPKRNYLITEQYYQTFELELLQTINLGTFQQRKR